MSLFDSLFQPKRLALITRSFRQHAGDWDVHADADTEVSPTSHEIMEAITRGVIDGKAYDAAYPARADGKTFFPFRRIFVVAQTG